MTKFLDLPVEPLLAKTFAPFGVVIEELDPSIRQNGPRKPAQRLPLGVDSRADLQIVRYGHQAMEQTVLERHLNVTESRFPLSENPVVLVVAPSFAESSPNADVPDVENARAFLFGRGQGVLLWRDAWHGLDCFPVAPPYSDFALLSEAETEAELESDVDPDAYRRSQFVDLERLAGTRLRVCDPRGLLPKDSGAD